MQRLAGLRVFDQRARAGNHQPVEPELAVNSAGCSGAAGRTPGRTARPRRCRRRTAAALAGADLLVRPEQGAVEVAGGESVGKGLRRPCVAGPYHGSRGKIFLASPSSSGQRGMPGRRDPSRRPSCFPSHPSPYPMDTVVSPGTQNLQRHGPPRTRPAHRRIRRHPARRGAGQGVSRRRDQRADHGKHPRAATCSSSSRPARR